MRFLRSSPWVLSAAGVLMTLITFLAGFTFFFPAESLRPRLEAEGAKQEVRLTINALQTTFPLGLAATGVTISALGKESLDVEIEEIRVAPLWSRLLLGQAVLAYDASLLGGKINGTMQRRGPLTLHGEGLLWRSALPGMSGGILVTRLRSAEVSAFWPAQADDELHLAIACEETKIEGLFGSKSPLLLGNVTLNASGKGKDLRLTSLAASGGQLGLEGSGTVLLNQPLGRSLLNLNLTLRGNASLDPTLAELLAAFIPPGTDGTSRLRLTGTLAAPQQSASGR